MTQRIPLEAVDAVDGVLSAFRGGGGPVVSLSAIMALPAEAPNPLGLTPTQRQLPRLPAFKLLWQMHEAGVPDATSRDLMRAAFDAWEQELSRHEDPFLQDVAALELIEALRDFGDTTGARRVVDIGDPIPDSTLIRRLAAAGLLDEALNASSHASIDKEEAFVLRRHEKWVADERVRAERITTQFVAELKKGIEEGDIQGTEADVAGVEARFKAALIAEATPLSDEELRKRAMSGFSAARTALMKDAIAEGREDIARIAANSILADLTDALTPLSSTVEIQQILRTASPDVAAAWLEAHEKRLLRPDPSLIAGKWPEIILGGWVALGKADRAERVYRAIRLRADEEAATQRLDPSAYQGGVHALAAYQYLLDQDRVDEARPLVVNNLIPLLRNDLKRGRGAVNLDEYLASTPNPYEKTTLIDVCADEAERLGLWDVAEDCIERRLANPRNERDAAGRVADILRLSASAARANQLTEAWRLAGVAFARTPTVPTTNNRLTIQSMSGSLISIAIAELREDGRLPPVQVATVP